MDYPRQETVRQRTAAIVKDQSIAEKLKAFYPSWCKRPCFHDEYLPCFNLPNVHLIDTDGKGADRLTSTSLIANGKDYPLDCLIFSTVRTLRAHILFYSYFLGLDKDVCCPGVRCGHMSRIADRSPMSQIAQYLAELRLWMHFSHDISLCYM